MFNIKPIQVSGKIKSDPIGSCICGKKSGDDVLPIYYSSVYQKGKQQKKKKKRKEKITTKKK